ncbi:hypothetical protein QA634_27985 [Methylobacterium sp. CB376]|uniref:hypothetical protein n=1 Tax=unclassified Methylobacterium TaxID=2615210 RepID=UPI00030FAE79|nr:MULTISPECIES: hypothetical protein [Methylobacterium]WFT79045.1 hypothetical protein QA634_27985 [Methylobacterium nodulans]
MKMLALPVALAAVALASAAPAEARGCIKAALVGGTAGHVAGHHGVLGAAAGCAVGRWHANRTSSVTRGSRTRNASHVY